MNLAEWPIWFLVLWVLTGAIAGALVAPRQGWEASVAAIIGGTFGMLGVLFLLVKRP